MRKPSMTEMIAVQRRPPVWVQAGWDLSSRPPALETASLMGVFAPLSRTGHIPRATSSDSLCLSPVSGSWRRRVAIGSPMARAASIATSGSPPDFLTGAKRPFARTAGLERFSEHGVFAGMAGTSRGTDPRDQDTGVDNPHISVGAGGSGFIPPDPRLTSERVSLTSGWVRVQAASTREPPFPCLVRMECDFRRAWDQRFTKKKNSSPQATGSSSVWMKWGAGLWQDQ